jgi:hypothetical protein
MSASFSAKTGLIDNTSVTKVPSFARAICYMLQLCSIKADGFKALFGSEAANDGRTDWCNRSGIWIDRSIR